VADDDRMPVHGIDHVELYVGNAAQAAFYFVHAFGFTETAYAGLETGRRDRVSHVLEQGRIRLVLTGTLQGGDEIAAHHAFHGDGVHKIALSVPDAEAAYHHAVEHGARGLMTPHWARTATLSTCSSSARATRATSCPASRSAARPPITPTTCA
jgi:4-hydroxyphenylpyruvate dioxygenase